MDKETISIPLVALPPDGSQVGQTVQVLVTAKVASLEQDRAVLQLQMRNGEAELEEAGDEAALRHLAAAADDEAWSD